MHRSIFVDLYVNFNENTDAEHYKTTELSNVKAESDEVDVAILDLVNHTQLETFKHQLAYIKVSGVKDETTDEKELYSYTLSDIAKRYGITFLYYKSIWTNKEVYVS